MLEILVMVSGGGTNLQAIMDAIDAGTITNARIKGVLSSSRSAYALERARAGGIPADSLSRADYTDEQEYHQALLERIRQMDVELIVLAGYLGILPGELVRAFAHKIINIHPSLIPAFCGKGYYGLRVHEEALARGVKVTGATVHFVDEGTDTGPIIFQKAVAVGREDTPRTLQKRVMEEAEWVLLPKAIDGIANGKIRVAGNRVVVDAETEMEE